jgi:hypothetical protein
MIRRTLDAALLLFALSNGYHLGVVSLRFFAADRKRSAPDLTPLFTSRR